MAYPQQFIRNPTTGQSYLFLQTAASTGGALLEMQSEYDAISTEPPMHYHPHQTEDFKVLQGELTVKIHQTILLLKKGDTLHIPPNTPHAMWNATHEKTVVNWQVKPAMQTEHLLEIFTGLAVDGKTSATGKPPFLQSVLLAKKFAAVFRLSTPPYIIQRMVFAVLAPVARLAGYRSEIPGM